MIDKDNKIVKVIYVYDKEKKRHISKVVQVPKKEKFKYKGVK